MIKISHKYIFFNLRVVRAGNNDSEKSFAPYKYHEYITVKEVIIFIL